MPTKPTRRRLDPGPLRERLAKAFARAAPPPRLTVSEWAERYRYLSRENSAEPGRFRLARTPYLRGILDAVTEPGVWKIVVKKSARVGYTDGVLNNVVGYFIDQDPSPQLVVQISEDEAEKWSKEQLAPMLRDTPKLRGKVKEPRSRASDNTILTKAYPGGLLGIAGANAPRHFRRRTARIVSMDEVSGYVPGPEGDQLALAEKRTLTFWNPLILMGSTPHITGFCRITKEFERSDQRHYYVPCPFCGHRQVLVWKNLRWDKTHDDRHLPETAAYMCEGCGTLIPESHKAPMVGSGQWVAHQPEVRGVAGFYVNTLYSLFHGARWSVLAREFLDAKDEPEKLHVFVNTVLGEPWEETAERIDSNALTERRETYPAEVPMAVGVLTAGVDVQADRVEVTVRGWGAGQESWLILHERLYGDPDQDEVWDQLDAILFRTYRHESGAPLTIRSAAIDTGYRTLAVYQYVRPRQGRGVHATKGVLERGKALISKPGKANRHGVKLFTIGTVTAKDRLFARLRRRTPGPGYMHFPAPKRDGEETIELCDKEYLQQFAAEKVVPKRRPNGGLMREYVQVAERNEAIDLEVLNLAALYIAGSAVAEHLDEIARQVAELGTKLQQAAQPSAPPQGVQAPVVARPRRNWVTGWKR